MNLRNDCSRTERRGAVAFILIIVLVVGLLVGTAVLFLIPGKVTVTSVSSLPAATPVTVAWTFEDPTVEVRDGRWVIAAELTVTSTDPVTVEVSEAFVKRGASRRRAAFEAGPPDAESQKGPVVFELDALAGTVPPELEIQYRVTLSDGLVLDQVHREELRLEGS